MGEWINESNKTEEKKTNKMLKMIYLLQQSSPGGNTKT